MTIAFALGSVASLRPSQRSAVCTTSMTVEGTAAQAAQAQFARQQGREAVIPPVFISDLADAAYGISDCIPAALRTLMGNANIFEAEMETLSPIVNRLSASGDVREFVREVGKSDSFRRRFFNHFSTVRFIDVAFKLLLARAPSGQQEVSEYVALLAESGYDAVIDRIVDSAEYAERFGSSLVPNMTATGKYVGGMPGFSAQMKMQLHTRGANTDATSAVPSTLLIHAAGDPAAPVEIIAGYSVTHPRYAALGNWNALPRSTLLKDWAAAALVPNSSAVNWSGLGTPRPTGEAKEAWSAGWAPKVTGKTGKWEAGWAPAYLKSYV